MENVKKNYYRCLLLIGIAIINIVGLYVNFIYFEDSVVETSDHSFFVVLFSGLFILGALAIFGMMYVFGILVVLSFVFATIARFTYKGEMYREKSYRGMMITAYVFLSLNALSMVLVSAMMNTIIVFLLSVAYIVLLVVNMIATFKANVVDGASDYNSNLYYNHNVNYAETNYNNLHFNQNYNNVDYNNQNYKN